MARNERIQKTFCTTREAAQMLGVSLRTAQLWAESGLLEAWKTDGGHRRISRHSVERLLASPAANSPSNNSAQTAPTIPVTVPPLSILVVEDERSLCRVYELTIARWDMKPVVATAHDGYEALIRMGMVRPDLLITDLRMPGMDGFRMLQTVRELPELAGMAIVVVTGLDPEEIADHGGLPEDIQVLPKPIPFAQLHEIAERVAVARDTAMSQKS